MAQPLIIQYTNLLHKHGGPDAKQVKAFKDKHKKDSDFIRRAETLDRVFVKHSDQSS